MCVLDPPSDLTVVNGRATAPHRRSLELEQDNLYIRMPTGLYSRMPTLGWRAYGPAELRVSASREPRSDRPTVLKARGIITGSALTAAGDAG